MPSEESDPLEFGELTLIGQITHASNATLVCDAVSGENTVRCVYKPIRGERPLWDFPDGTLAGREYASYLVSEQLGWGVIPRTLLRDGPFGPG
ncbi:MAG: phosphatidylinositol kinase, partial [Rhodococcus sp. (in: high G+C Gram-positive bacteria)]